MTDLDIQLAQALDLPIFTLANYTFVDGRHDWSPSTRWDQAGPLIEEYGVSLKKQGDYWLAECKSTDTIARFYTYFDESPTVAAMMCIHEILTRRH